MLVPNRSFGRWLLACSWIDAVQLVDTFGIVFAIILLSDSKYNHSLKRQIITHLHRTFTRITCALAELSKNFSRPSSITSLQWRIHSAAGITSRGRSRHYQWKVKWISWCWRLKSQALLRWVGHPSCHYSTRWLPPKLSIELKVPSITPPPRLIVVFICRALRFFSTQPPLARKTLICKWSFSWKLAIKQHCLFGDGSVRHIELLSLKT